MARLLPPESASLEAVSLEIGVSEATLERWRSDALSIPARERAWTAAARLDAVILLCEAQRPAIAAHVDPARIHIVPHGIDSGFFTPGPRAAGDGFRLLSVGHWLRDHAAAFVALAMVRQASSVAAMGFSSSTCLPARSAARLTSA